MRTTTPRAAHGRSPGTYHRGGAAAAAGGGPGAVRPPLRLLEVGLGTGLNALLTLEAAQQAGAAVVYDGLDTYSLPPAVVATLRPKWTAQPGPAGHWFAALHAAPWNAAMEMAPGFSLTKLRKPLQETTLPAGAYDLIYFDAFAPEKQPELWTEAVFARLYAAAAPGALLVSYCAQGHFRRRLRAAGWRIEKRPGPPGKREMTQVLR